MTNLEDLFKKMLKRLKLKKNKNTLIITNHIELNQDFIYVYNKYTNSLPDL